MSKNKEKMGRGQVARWSSWNQCMLEQARRGNMHARNSLFESLRSFLEMVHTHSQDGLFPSKFGFTYNQSGRLFEEASSDVFRVYSKCVDCYDESFGVPFCAYVANELKLRAMDWVRARKGDRLVCVEENVLDAFPSRESDLSSSVENKDLVRKVFCAVRQSGDKKLVKFLELLLECGDEMGGMSEIAQRMSVSRATTYNYLRRIRELLQSEFGEFFKNAA